MKKLIHWMIWRFVLLTLMLMVLAAFFFYREGFAQCQEQTAAPTLPSDTWDYKIINLPVVIGIFHGFDLPSGQLSVALDKKHTKLETINLKKIRSVYLLQGNKEKLGNFLEGVTYGAGGGFIASLAENKLKQEPNNSQLFSKDTARNVALGMAVGVVIGWWQNRGVEDARPWPVYSLDIYQNDPGASGKVNFKDPHNLEKILPDSFIQVLMSSPE